MHWFNYVIMIMHLVDDLPLQSQETIHQVGKRSEPTFFQTVFKDYQQTTKVATTCNKEIARQCS